MAIIKSQTNAESRLIPKAVIDQVTQRANENLDQVIGEVVALRKAGSTSVGLCPFHNEKSPSFNVMPGKGFFFCHGCGASGDAVGFLKDYFGTRFPDAIRELAARFGISIQGGSQAYSVSGRTSGPQRPLSQGAPQDAPPVVSPERRQTLTAALDAALAFYRAPAQRQLPLSKTLEAWAAKRQLTAESIDRFELGVAPASWNGLLAVFGDAYRSDQALLDVDLLREREGKPGQRYDTFRDRIIFPVRDSDGNLVGFGGRRLAEGEKDTRSPKYLNTGTTDIFHKGHLLYGLHQARAAIKEREHAIVVEGYMDVVMLAQWGFPNTVASMGTAFRGSHLNLLRQHTSEVVYLFDGDHAGQRAMWTAVKESLPFADRVNFRFITLNGQDPDEWVRAVGPEAVHQAVLQAESLGAYFLRRAREILEEDAAGDESPPIAVEGLKRSVGQASVDRKRELTALVTLVPEGSSLRRYLDRELRQIFSPGTGRPQEESEAGSELDTLPPEKRLAVAAMLRPDLALKARPALIALLPQGHPKTPGVLALYDRGIARGNSDAELLTSRSTSDLSWARVTLVKTPELLTELLAPAVDTDQVVQNRQQDRSTPSS